MMQELHDRMTTRPSRRLTAPMLRVLLWCLVVFMWTPAIAVPAAVVLAKDATPLEPLLNVPPVLMLLSVVVSTLSGATALLIRIDRELSAAPEKPLPRPIIMSTSHMAGSWSAGVLAFIFSRQWSVDVWGTLAFVLTASFLGAKFIEMAAEKIWPARLNPGGSPP